jgi:hypothetical protein
MARRLIATPEVWGRAGMKRSTRTEEDVADGLSYICGHLDHIRARVAGTSAGAAALDSVLAALREARNPAAALEDLHRSLRAAGDALGVFGNVRGGTDLVTPPGVESAGGSEFVYVCPRDAHPCTRYVWPSAATDPRCEVSDQELRRVAL